MSNNKSSFNLKNAAIYFSLGLSILPTLSVGVEAQTLNIGQGKSQPILISQFKAPSVGAPPTTSGGGTRARICTTNQERPDPVTLTKIMPLTTSDTPAFLVYLPENTAKKGEFVLKDAQGDDVYRFDVTLPKSPGLFKVQYDYQNALKKYEADLKKYQSLVRKNRNAIKPEKPEEPKLEAGKLYNWYFSLVCKPNDRREDVLIQGFVQKAQPISNIDKLQGLPKAKAYANNGIWQEAVSNLADLVANPPSAKDKSVVESEWKKLLESVGLTQFVDKKIAK
ncbi:MAG TPA: DUF928 domain-containing protein [Allocoleopsis sp.]